MEDAVVEKTGFGLFDAWLSLSAEPAWTEITAWLIPVVAIFLTLFAVEIRRGYRE